MLNRLQTLPVLHLTLLQSKELILEGIAREFVSKVQNMRKANDYNVVDRISISVSGDASINKCFT